MPFSSQGAHRRLKCPRVNRFRHSSRFDGHVTLKFFPAEPRNGCIICLMRLSHVAAAVVIAVSAVVLNAQAIANRSIGNQSAIPNPKSTIASPWHRLFDGSSLAAWKGYRTDAVPSGWKIVSKELVKDEPVEDLVTRDQFGDFELELEWKIGKAGNSGIFYRGIEDPDYAGELGTDRLYMTGPEYQLLDDIDARDNKTRLTCAGAAYGLYPSPAGHLKPVGEWNQTRIVARGAHVEHWLNGVKLLEYELWSADWTAKVAATKFSAWPKFGLAKRGHIGLQGDHEGSLGFRNIRIREVQ